MHRRPSPHFTPMTQRWPKVGFIVVLCLGGKSPEYSGMIHGPAGYQSTRVGRPEWCSTPPGPGKFLNVFVRRHIKRSIKNTLPPDPVRHLPKTDDFSKEMTVGTLSRIHYPPDLGQDRPACGWARCPQALQTSVPNIQRDPYRKNTI